ncbi:MAG: PASTA domain-containing protein [Pyrinomonadaceae bacterium]
MTVKERAVSVVGQGAILVAIAVAFFLGLLGTIYLSLRSPEVKVPDIVGKDRTTAESTISNAGLNFRVRATRPIGSSHPDTVLLQLPGAGEMVKAGQTVAVDISRAAKEGEAVTSGAAAPTPEKPADNENKTTSDNLNDNKPKKPKTANKNANGNANGNANANRPGANGNRNANLRVVNNNTQNRSAGQGSNANARVNANRGVDSNNQRPPGARPSPVSRPTP